MRDYVLYILCVCVVYVFLAACLLFVCLCARLCVYKLDCWVAKRKLKEAEKKKNVDNKFRWLCCSMGCVCCVCVRMCLNCSDPMAKMVAKIHYNNLRLFTGYFNSFFFTIFSLVNVGKNSLAFKWTAFFSFRNIT